MAEDRPFPPSARRRNLAIAAGVSGASPLVVGAVAWVVGLAAVFVLGRAIAAELGARVADACRGAAAPWSPSPSGAVSEVMAFVLPIAIAIAAAAVAAHLAQTRRFWFPRRTIRGAPVLETSRVHHALIGILGAAAVGVTTLGWLWAIAPRLAQLVAAPRAGALVVLGFVATLAVVWIVIGVVDALLRHAELSRSLHMTAADKREDVRATGADPRWRARRSELDRNANTRDAVAGSSVVILGDGVAAAIAWDPVRRPVPVRTATGAGARATQILGLARRHGIPVHREVELASALGGGDGPVPEGHWPRLAEIIAATARRTGSM